MSGNATASRRDLAPVIADIRASGCVSLRVIATEPTSRGIRSGWGRVVRVERLGCAGAHQWVTGGCRLAVIEAVKVKVGKKFAVASTVGSISDVLPSAYDNGRRSGPAKDHSC